VHLHVAHTKHLAVLRHATRRCETSGRLSYFDHMLALAHFSCQAQSFQEWRILCIECCFISIIPFPKYLKHAINPSNLQAFRVSSQKNEIYLNFEALSVNNI